MLELTPKAKMAATAKTLAQSYELVQYHGHTYIPQDWETGVPGPTSPDRCVWKPLDRDSKRRMANALGNILFANDSEISNFDLMLRQYAREELNDANHLLIRTPEGLRVLTGDGQFEHPDGSFYPNFIAPQLNEDPVVKAEVMKTISEWLNSEAEAVSLLRHLSTALSPGWSAVKYVIFIGGGRNGKSVLLLMLSDLFGRDNISGVTRQQIADRLPTCQELNGKLLNIVMDGQMAYIKDSSMEKTVIAGEPAYIRMLYENGNTRVQTNALFLEALNSEPKTRDKSSALQKRLSRFLFPNTYDLDKAFEKKMRSEEYLGAFLSLLLDHFVREDDIAEKLAQTAESAALQVEQQLLNSPLLQYLQHLIHTDPSWIGRFEATGAMVDPLINSFMAWRIQEGYSEYSSMDVRKMFREYFQVVRKSIRENSKVIKKEALGLPKPELQAFLDQLKGETNAVQPDTVVDE